MAVGVMDEIAIVVAKARELVNMDHPHTLQTAPAKEKARLLG